jgi:hypothetical protein
LVVILFLSSCGSIRYEVAPIPTEGGNAVFVIAKEGISDTGSETSKKKGTACIYNWMGLISFGTADIESIKSRADISQVTSIDIEKEGIGIMPLNLPFYIYGRACLVVSGI